jgi:spore germination cell wall hydrolase CwlJ-like protein
LTSNTTARADVRALAAGLAIGATVGLLLGGAYVAGDMAQAADAHAKTVRVASAAAPVPATPAQGNANLRGPATPSLPTAVPLAVTRVSTSSVKPFRVALGGRDLDCLADAIYYEARGETPEGQAAIAQVVLNRVRHPNFPKSVCGVVFQTSGDDCQFSFACNGSMNRPKEAAAWSRAEQVAARALSGVVMAQVGEATSFHRASVSPGWGPGLMQVAQIGLHVFYRSGGHVGSGAGVRPSAPGSDGPRPVLASMMPTFGTTNGRPSASYAAVPASSAAQPAAAVVAQPAPVKPLQVDAAAKPAQQIATAS